jgi:hypothetical protein
MPQISDHASRDDRSVFSYEEEIQNGYVSLLYKVFLSSDLTTVPDPMMKKILHLRTKIFNWSVLSLLFLPGLTLMFRFQQAY